MHWRLSLYLAIREATYSDVVQEPVGDKFEGEDFFIANLYHQCYFVDEMPKRRKTSQRKQNTAANAG
jgi:hypothetical protein